MVAARDPRLDRHHLSSNQDLDTCQTLYTIVLLLLASLQKQAQNAIVALEAFSCTVVLLKTVSQNTGQQRENSICFSWLHERVLGVGLKD